MPAPLTDLQLAAITDALRAGNKIEAVKLHRAATGFGLKESKDEIESIEADLRAKFPDQFPARSSASAQSKGCLGLVALLLAATTTLGWWIADRL